jgi:hypothetical protein
MARFDLEFLFDRQEFRCLVAQAEDFGALCTCLLFIT